LSFLGFWLSVSFAGSQFTTVADGSGDSVIHTRVVSCGFQPVSLCVTNTRLTKLFFI